MKGDSSMWGRSVDPTANSEGEGPPEKEKGGTVRGAAAEARTAAAPGRGICTHRLSGKHLRAPRRGRRQREEPSRETTLQQTARDKSQSRLFAQWSERKADKAFSCE